MPPVPALTATRVLTPEPLNVAPPLVGRALGTPARRAGAMALDLLAVALLSSVSGFWLVAGLALVVVQLGSRRGGSRLRTALGWGFAALLALLALQAAWDDGDEASSRPAAASTAADRADGDDGGDEGRAAAPAASGAALSDAQRIAQLEAQVAELKRPRPWRWRDELDRLLEAAGASFGWGIVYFSLLPAWWGGQTLGKKLLRLRVVELTGQPMTVLRCLRRYGGYAAGMATGGLGFLQMLWDPNLQGIQDRTAHTVVLDLRESPAAVAAEAA